MTCRAHGLLLSTHSVEKYYSRVPGMQCPCKGDILAYIH